MSWEEDKEKGKWLVDSKGAPHYVILQELDESCAPACVAMAESYYKSEQMVNPEKRAGELSRKYQKSWTAGGEAYPSSLSDVLNAEGIKTYGATCVETSQLYDYFYAYVGDQTPMIVQIDRTKEGHFALLRKVYSDGTMVFLDPWFGIVEVNYYNLPSYRVKGASGKFSGWVNVTYH